MDELLYVICRGIVEFFVKRIPEPLWQSLTMRKRGVRIAAILLFYLMIFALMANKKVHPTRIQDHGVRTQRTVQCIDICGRGTDKRAVEGASPYGIDQRFPVGEGLSAL